MTQGSDAYVYAVENAADFDGVPVDVAVVPMHIALQVPILLMSL